jgi:hypothetical protein
MYRGTRLINSLHTDTHDWVIRDNLFIKKGTVLNKYLVADNERYLRSLEFIQDARIIARPIKGSKDSVDLEVITKDLFSLTGSLEIGSDRQKIRIAENNYAGAGQKIQLTTLFDKRRDPRFGYDLLYTKNSVLHTFVNASVGYSKIFKDREGDEAVSSFYVQLFRPLLSPYSRFAGGLQVSLDKSDNAYKKSNRLYYNFQNTTFDVWGGYNIGVNKLMTDNQYRKRAFLALRYIDRNFSHIPAQVGNSFDPFFNNLKAYLAELTLFRQEFYKTNYIYGFGTTEDVPYGYNVAVTGGYTKQLNASRPYLGVNASRFIITPKNEFLQAFVRVGGFSQQKRLEDIGLLAGGSYYSTLQVYNNIKMRQYVRFSYARILRRKAAEPLRIDNALGLPFFGADSLRGVRRISAYAENYVFLKGKIFGFLFAPFAFADAAFITPENRNIFRSGLYTGIGGGLRARNENLVSGTMELRFSYFPKVVQDLNNFRISFISNIRFRYNSNYVKAPDVVQLNTAEDNIFY